MKSTGSLHLIPVGLGDAPPSAWLPGAAAELASRLTVYIAENAKTARAFLKLVGTTTPLQEITIHTLTGKVGAAQIKSWLTPLLAGGDIGLVSEAGCPPVADPRAKLAPMATAMGISAVPLIGRATCRAIVWPSLYITGLAVTLHKKTKLHTNS